MKILLIGNGFDLEHGLPTRYSDFLDFTDKFLKMAAADNPLIIMVDYRWNTPICEYLKLLYQESSKADLKENLIALLKDNCWIRFFENRKMQENGTWIDFESEISYVVRTLEKAKVYLYGEIEKEVTDIKTPWYLAELLRDLDNKPHSNTFITKKTFQYRKAKLLEDLNDLIRSLEIYLTDYVENIDIQYYNPDISTLYPDSVLTFNYTDTYRKVYASNRSQIEYDFIHGKANISNTVFSNNMVLGIDEHLSDNSKNINTEFIAFKKFYQRIHKRTGSRYKEWIDIIEKSKKTDNNEKHELYVFGHSLDVTDKDILGELLKNNNIITTVYYYDENTYGSLIENLVKVIGCDELIKRVYGVKRSIIFKQQQARQNISGSPFESETDRLKLLHIYEYKTDSAKELLKKIDERITNQASKREQNYFHTQENVISFFDSLIGIGLAEKYKYLLLAIAKDLIPKDNSDKSIKYDYSKWNYYDYAGEHMCSMETMDFIKRINDFNAEEYSKGTEYDLVKDRITILKVLCRKNNLPVETFEKAIDTILEEFDNPQCDTKELWKIAYKLVGVNNSSAVDKCLYERINSEKDIIKMRRLLHLKECYEEEDYYYNRFGYKDF